jgi:DNA-3-methyladenine glycosylase II
MNEPEQILSSSQVNRGELQAAREFLRHADPILAQLIDTHPDFDPRAWLSELPKLDAFGTLVFQVIGQQLSVQATRRILDRLRELFGGNMPTPAQLLSASPDSLRSAGLSHRKVATLRLVAEYFVDGRLSQKRLEMLSDQDIEAQLTAIPGIGPWTVHGFLIIALNRTDVVLPGDLALRKSIQRVYKLSHLPTPDEVIQLAEHWRPYRSLATAYLFQAAFDTP